MKKLLIIAVMLFCLNSTSMAWIVFSRSAVGGGPTGYNSVKTTSYSVWLYGVEVGFFKNIECKDPGHEPCPASVAPAGGGQDDPADETATEQLVPYALQNESNSGHYSIDLTSGSISYRYTVIWVKDPNGDSFINIDKTQIP